MRMAVTHTAAVTLIMPCMSAPPPTSVDYLVDRLSIRSERQRTPRTADRITVVFSAGVVPGPRPCRLLAIALGDAPRALERFRVLDHHLRLDRHVVDLAHASRGTARIAQDQPGPVDDHVVVR